MIIIQKKLNWLEITTQTTIFGFFLYLSHFIKDWQMIRIFRTSEKHFNIFFTLSRWFKKFDIKLYLEGATYFIWANRETCKIIINQNQTDVKSIECKIGNIIINQVKTRQTVYVYFCWAISPMDLPKWRLLKNFKLV